MGINRLLIDNRISGLQS